MINEKIEKYMKLIILSVALLIVSCLVLFGGKKGLELGREFDINNKKEAGCMGCLTTLILLIVGTFALTMIVFH